MTETLGPRNYRYHQLTVPIQDVFGGVSDFAFTIPVLVPKLTSHVVGVSRGLM